MPKDNYWDPKNAILDNYVDSEMKKNPHKVFRNLAPSCPPPKYWNRDKGNVIIQGKTNKKKKHTSKADIIIQNNKVRMGKKQTETEIEKLNNTYTPLSSDCRTEIGNFYKSVKCLEYFYKKKDNKAVIDIWLNYEKKYNELEENYSKNKKEHIYQLYHSHKKIINKTKEIYKGIDNLKRYQLEEMGSFCTPLDYSSYYNKEFILDEWQCRALNLIDNRKSILLCAPTSSGKTMITTYLVQKSDRILFIVPSLPLCLQVAAMFYGIESGQVWVLDEDLTYKTDSIPKIIIGTPDEVLRQIDSIELESISTLVIDEIHEVNISHNIENIIHTVMNSNNKSIQFLGLSATIGNPEEFHGWLQLFDNTIELITVTNRFFNLSRFIYSSNDFHKITPCHTMRTEDLVVNGLLDYPFTPKDLVILSDKMVEKGFEVDKPEKYFDSDDRISLKRCQEYSKYLMKIIQTSDNIKITSLVNDLKEEFENMNLNSEGDINIYELTNSISDNKYTPSIFFNLNNLKLKNYFDTLLNTFKMNEEKKYPRHQQSLQKEMEKYNSLMEKRKKELEKINNPDKQANWMRDNPEPEVPSSVGSPHPDFTLKVKGEKVQVSDINENKDKICSEFVKRNMTDQIPALLELFNALLRGFAIYSKDLPTAYLRCVQELAQQGKLAIIFSDKSLAFGINMPISTVCFCGDTDTLDTLMYQQMEGRCGRRGLDKKGNVIFAGISNNKICNLVNGIVIPIKGNPNILNENILALPEINNKNKCIESIVKNNLANFNNIKLKNISFNIDESTTKMRYLPKNYLPLLWKLSKNPESYSICAFMVWFEKQTKLHRRLNESDDIHFFGLISFIIQNDVTKNNDLLINEKSIKDNEYVKDLIQYIEDHDYLDDNTNYTSNTLYKTFRLNGIQKEIRNDINQFSKIKKQLNDANMIMLTLRNHFRKTNMELILRKVWRRLYWISKTISIY
jgi:hypothetical protein